MRDPIVAEIAGRPGIKDMLSRTVELFEEIDTQPVANQDMLFERHEYLAFANLVNFLKIASCLARETGTQNKNETKDKWRRLSVECETQARRRGLLSPPTEDDFRQCLYKTAELGNVDDLNLLRAIRENPPYQSKELIELVEVADRRICERVYDPERVVQREEQAYQRNRDTWDRQYSGEFIAIHCGQVIDHDVDKLCLIQRLDQLQQKNGGFRAYIVEIGGPIYHARSPRIKPLKPR
jgi:hypothetical protein